MTDPKAAVTSIPLATPEETKAQAEEQLKEYGTYVATQVIYYNGVIAYRPGDSVPVSNVERHGYADQRLVEKINSAAGQELIRQLHEATLAQPAEAAAEPVRLSVPVNSTK
jgi:hypothetical protein